MSDSYRIPEIAPSVIPTVSFDSLRSGDKFQLVGPEGISPTSHLATGDATVFTVPSGIGWEVATTYGCVTVAPGARVFIDKS